MQINPILSVDSYKLCHAFSYPSDVTGMYSYIEARTEGDDIILFGLQTWLKNFLSIKVTHEHVNEAELFARAHGEPFYADGFRRIVDKYGGVWPVTIKSVPEGLPIKSGNAIVTIECVDPELFWVSSFLETSLLRAVWYPTTVASRDYDIKKYLYQAYKDTGCDTNLVQFALHDFGSRGVSSKETAEIGGAAHLVNFSGSDNIEGIRAANYYYNHEMAGFSVPATEHSVQCAFGSGESEQEEYIFHQLEAFSNYNIVSIVCDGYDIYREVDTICRNKQRVIQSGRKLVIRPDSGDMKEVIKILLTKLEDAFGVTYTSTLHKRINNVGILQGDGISNETLKELLDMVIGLGYAADCIVFGSGGALLQKVNRDTYKFAQKASSIRKDGKWIGIAKDPITDTGKRSKPGRVETHYENGTYKTDDWNDNSIMIERFNVMKGIVNETTLDEVRNNTELW